MALFSTAEIEHKKRKNQLITLLIGALRLDIMVQSCIYYHFNDNVITDGEYDKRGKELIALQEKYPEFAKKAHFYEFFKDFNGECYSGYDLPYNDPAIITEAERLLKFSKED